MLKVWPVGKSSLPRVYQWPPAKVFLRLFVFLLNCCFCVQENEKTTPIIITKTPPVKVTGVIFFCCHFACSADFYFNIVFRFHVTTQCFIATIFVSESQLRDLSVYGLSSHNYQRNTPRSFTRLQYARDMLCCNITVTVTVPKTPKLQFYSIPKKLDQRNKLLASIRRHHWQLTYGK